MQSRDNCGVCGTPLVYTVDSRQMDCVYCHDRQSTQIYCPEGHYVCDECHQRDALGILTQVLSKSTSTSPMEIFDRVVSHPSVPMHGPEHHALVPAAIVAAVRNAGYSVPPDAIEKAIARGAKVPGGWCGSHGVCGAAIGVGIAVSVITEATPLTGRQRSLANEATSIALAKMVDGHPRCCKRASRIAIESAVAFLRDRMNMRLDTAKTTACRYTSRNKQCPKEECHYYSAPGR